MKKVICIACGQTRNSNPKNWCDICECEKNLHATDGSYELHIRSNGRKLQLEDLDYYNPWATVLCDFEIKELILWDLNKVEEIARQYQDSFKKIGLAVPQLDLHILNEHSKIQKVVQLSLFV